MKVRYDKEADAAYIQLSRQRPSGAVEFDEGLIVHVTKTNRIVAIEILDASRRISIRNLFTLQKAA